MSREYIRSAPSQSFCACSCEQVLLCVIMALLGHTCVIEIWPASFSLHRCACLCIGVRVLAATSAQLPELRTKRLLGLRRAVQHCGTSSSPVPHQSLTSLASPSPVPHQSLASPSRSLPSPSRVPPQSSPSQSLTSPSRSLPSPSPVPRQSLTSPSQPLPAPRSHSPVIPPSSSQAPLSPRAPAHLPSPLHRP